MAASIASMSTSGAGCCFERQSVILRDTEVPAFWQAVVLTTAAIACLDKIDFTLE